MNQAQPHAPASPRLLCIEDDARLRRLLAEDLREAGYEVIEAADARAGFAAFLRHAPQLVLCDVRMPEMCGFDFLERMKKLDAGLFGAAFVFLTALADRENHLRGRRLGADDYVTKPIDYEILREILAIRLAGRPVAAPPPALAEATRRALCAWFETGDGPPPESACQALRDGMARAMPPHDPSLRATLDGICIGVVIADTDGRVHYANESAASVLGWARQAAHGARLSVLSPRLDAVARQHARTGKTQPGQITAHKVFLREDADPVTVVARFAAADAPLPASAQRITLLMPIRPHAPPAFADIVRDLFGLTPSEAALAACIAAGTGLADIAEQRGVTLDTVRGQLKSIFLKVGVQRQQDLVGTLLTLQIAAG